MDEKITKLETKLKDLTDIVNSLKKRRNEVGPPGAIGPQGAVGPQGANGTEGPPGPAGSSSGIVFGFFFNDGYSQQSLAGNGYVNFGSVFNQTDAEITQESLSTFKVSKDGTYCVQYTIIYDATNTSKLSICVNSDVVGDTNDTTGVPVLIGSDLIATYSFVLNLEEDDLISIKNNTVNAITVKKAQLNIIQYSLAP